VTARALHGRCLIRGLEAQCCHSLWPRLRAPHRALELITQATHRRRWRLQHQSGRTKPSSERHLLGSDSFIDALSSHLASVKVAVAASGAPRTRSASARPPRARARLPCRLARPKGLCSERLGYVEKVSASTDEASGTTQRAHNSCSSLAGPAASPSTAPSRVLRTQPRSLSRCGASGCQHRAD
jgi:hypothetical protein